MSATRRRRVSAYGLVAAVGSLLLVALWTHAGFERIRFRVVTEPVVAREPTLAVPLPDISALAGQPAAIVVRLRAAGRPLHAAIAFDDGEPVARVHVGPSRSVRVDAADLLTERPAVLTLRADGTEWALEYLEIANVHGFSRGWASFVIVPDERLPTPPLPPWLLAVLAIALLAGQPAFGGIGERRVRLLYRSLSVLILALVGGLLLTEALTPYRVLLSPGTAAALIAVLYAEPLLTLRRQPFWVSPAARAVYAALPHAAVALLVAVSLARWYAPDVGLTRVIRFGERFQARALPDLQGVPRAVTPGPGYDGQFYAQLALDPLLRDAGIARALDSPRYRARRILLPWVAWALGGGDPSRIVYVYAWLNVAAWVALGALLLVWLPPGTARTTAAWVGCVCSHGLLSSVTHALPDGPGVLLIAGGIAALERGRSLAAAALLAAAGLARETNLLGAGALLPQSMRAGPLRQAAVRLLVAAAPLVLWVAYVLALDLPGSTGGSRNFAWPFQGYVANAAAAGQELLTAGWRSPARASLLTHAALATQAIVIGCRIRTAAPWWRAAAPFVLLMVVLGPAVWEGAPGSATRVLLPLTVAFNILIVRERWFWPLWLLGNANLLHGLQTVGATEVVPLLGRLEAVW